MKIHVLGLFVFLSAVAALGAQPEARSNKEPAKKSSVVSGPDERQRRLLFSLQSLRSSPEDRWESMWDQGPVVLRGKLVKTGDGSTFFTKERKRRQTGSWVLEARLDSDIVWVPLVRVGANEKLLDAAEELAGRPIARTRSPRPQGPEPHGPQGRCRQQTKPGP